MVYCARAAGRRGIYSFYFSFEGERVADVRDGITDYSGYLDRWGLILGALEE